MWWEVLPPAAIMLTCFSLVDIFPYYYKWLWNGTPYKRFDGTKYSVYEILRDERLTGDSGFLWEHKRYQFYGLENIPDEPETKQAKKEC